MKFKLFFVLMLFISSTSVSQDLIRKIYTDKPVYQYGDTVYLTLRAVNTTDEDTSITFFDLCEAYPYVDDISYLYTFGIGCGLAISTRNIPAQDSIEWVFPYPHSFQPDSLMLPGIHSAYGFIKEAYNWNPVIFKTDTIEFYVNEGTNDTKENLVKYSFSLKQNYPNPFNPSTTIEFSLNDKSFVTLRIYNSIGQEVQTLIEKEMTAGYHKINWKPENLSGGIYFYKLSSEEKTLTRKLIYLK